MYIAVKLKHVFLCRKDTFFWNDLFINLQKIMEKNP